jgi:hypothetical protein
MKLNPNDIEPRTKSIYPEPFASMMNGRSKRALGNFFGIIKYGVNLTTIKPGGVSALMHKNSSSSSRALLPSSPKPKSSYLAKESAQVSFLQAQPTCSKTKAQKTLCI